MMANARNYLAKNAGFGLKYIPSRRPLPMARSPPASDEIDNINLAGSDAIADASFENFSNNFFLRAKGIKGRGGLANGEPNSCCGEIRWGDVIIGKFAGESGAFLTYVSPTWNGFELSSAVGQAQEIRMVNPTHTSHA